jgi:lantibiotic modifying enzyme
MFEHMIELHLKTIMNDMFRNEIIFYKNGSPQHVWGTQKFSNHTFQLGFTDNGLYDGLQGNILCSFFYSKLIDPDCFHYYEKYLNSFYNYLCLHEINDPAELGAFGIVGGGLFTLSTIKSNLDNELSFSSTLLNKCIDKILSAMERLISDNNSPDYIYGITGTLKRLYYAHTKTNLELNDLINVCLDKLSLCELNKRGYAHGCWGVYDTLINIDNDRGNRLLHKFNHVPTNSSLNSGRWEHSWCNGTIGEITMLLSMYKHSKLPDLSLLMGKYHCILNDINQDEVKCPIGVCHGALGFFDVIYEMQCLDIIQEDEYQRVCSHILSRLLNGNFIDYQISSNGLMTGKMGVAYQLMRLLHPKKIPSILV